MYEKLQQQYNLLSLEDKNALLIYKSRLFDFINRIDLILYNEKLKEQYRDKYEKFKKIISIPENNFIRYSIFNSINFNTYNLFLESIKTIEQRILNIQKIKLTTDTKVYRAVTVKDESDIQKISTSNLISTSLDIEITDSFYTYNGKDILYQINLSKGTYCLIVPYSIKIYEKDNKQILKIENNDSQKKIILFKNLLNYTIISNQYLKDENLIIAKIETSYNKNITK